MTKIIFKKLTTKEKKEVSGGGDPVKDIEEMDYPGVATCNAPSALCRKTPAGIPNCLAAEY